MKEQKKVILQLSITLVLLLFTFYSNPQSPVKKTSNPPPPPPHKGLKLQNTTSPKDLSYLVPPLTLKPETNQFIPKNFYLAGVEDSTGTDSLGYGILPGDYKKQIIKTEGNKETLLKNYFSALIKNDSSLYPIIIRLEKISITEKQLSKADLEGTIEISAKLLCKLENELLLVDQFTVGNSGELYIGSKRRYDSLVRMNLRRIPPLIDERMEVAAVMKEAFIKG